MIKICIRCFNTYTEAHAHEDCPMDAPGAALWRERSIVWPIKVKFSPSGWYLWGKSRTTRMIVGSLKYMATTYRLGPLVIEFGVQGDAYVSEESLREAVCGIYVKQRQIADDEIVKVQMSARDNVTRLIDAHQRCHSAYDEQIKVMCGAVIFAMEQLDGFAFELEREGYTVKADRLMEITTSLTWALEEKARRMRIEKGLPNLIDNQETALH